MSRKSVSTVKIKTLWADRRSTRFHSDDFFKENSLGIPSHVIVALVLGFSWESECEDESPDFGASEFGCLSEELVTRPVTSSAKPSIVPREIIHMAVELGRGDTIISSFLGVFW